MSVLPRPLPVPPVVLAAIAVLGAGCGGGEPGLPDDAGAAAAIDGAGATDTPATPVPPFTPVPLPADFPDDFPVPPLSTVTSANVLPDTDGTFTNVTIMSEGDPQSGYAWYREALARGGWTVTTEGVDDGTRSLHAEQGESYVDLTVAAHPAPGWTRSDAAIWKIHP